MANTLMFEVGIKRANEEYNKILEEVKALAKMADKPISVKLQLEKTQDLKAFLDALEQLGSGKMLQPMIAKVEQLQASLVRLGMVPKDINYDALEQQLNKVTAAWEKYIAARKSANLKGVPGLDKDAAADTAFTATLKNAHSMLVASLEKSYGMSENVARATVETYRNLGSTIESQLSRIGGSKAGMESLAGEVTATTQKVDALVNAFSSLVTQLKSLGSTEGVKAVGASVANVDKETKTMAEQLTAIFGSLTEKKKETTDGESALAKETNIASSALKAEVDQAKAAADSMIRLSESITVAALAAKNLYTIFGGNRQDVAKFLELSNTMDMLNRKAAYILNSSNDTYSGGKMGAFAEVKKEMEGVQAEMDALKKSASTGNPILESFAEAFAKLSQVLNTTSISVKEGEKALKSLGEGAKKINTGGVSQESYKQLGDVIQQLGVKYDLTADKVKKLKELIESGNLTTGNVQRKLKIDFNKATDIVESINAVQKNITSNEQLTSSEKKAAQGANEQSAAIQKLLSATTELTTATTNLKNAIGSWGQDKGTIATMIAQFDTLRAKITDVVAQWEKLAMVKVTGVQNVQTPAISVDLSGIEPAIKTLNEAVAQLKKSMDLLWESTNRMETSMKAIITPEAFKKLESDAATAKQKVDELSKSVEGMKTQAEKKGSETTLNANLDILRNHTQKVYEALSKMGTEYSKLEAAGIHDEATKQRIENLRAYYEWLQKVAQMQETLSKPGALKADATKFNGELLMGQVTKQMWSDKAVKEFAVLVDEALKGKQAFDSINEAMGRIKEKLLGMGTSAEGGMKGVGAAMETINKVGELNIQTLIKEQAHIERMMQTAQKSISYSEGHPVAGMDKLEQIQRDNMQYLQTLNRWINLILENRNNPDVIRFLNTPQSLKLPLPGRQDDVAMFNAHYDKLKHSITDTSAAARQLVKDMTMTDANASIKQWNTTRLETGLHNVNDAIQNILKSWNQASKYGDTEMAKSVAEQVNRLNAIKSEILRAMTDDKLLATRHGYTSVINPDSTHTIKESKDMARDLTAFRKEREKSEKEYNRNVERWQESQMKDFAKAEQEKAKAAQQAQKDIQREIQKTEAEMRKLDSAISRGNATPGRDMTLLSDARSKLQGQLSLLQKTTPADLQNSKLIEKRIQDIRTLRDDTDALRKSEERLTTAQQQANRRSDRADDKKLKDEIKSVNDAYVKYNELGAKINELIALKNRGIAANIDVTAVQNYIDYLERIRTLMKEIYSNNGRTVSNSAANFNINSGMLASEALHHNNVKSGDYFRKNEIAEFKRELGDAEKRMNSAAKTSDNLVTRISKLGLVRVDFAKLGLDTTALDNAIARIHAIQQELASFARTGSSAYGNNAKSIVQNMGLDAANKAATDAIKKLNVEQRESAHAANHMTAEQQRLAQALNHTTESAKGQSQVLSDLKMMATQYLSIWGAQSFLNNIIEIGGQLEMQRLSIGAILGDTAHANDLFDKIKAQAIQSPFGVVELDQMTKQLSAYGFQYNELFDMTKRLADISAATGTSVDRLALALGHVRAEAALSGYTLRQFSMANIPLAKKLSEQLTEVEKRFVSVAEVRKRVSKKEIGYEEVVNVLKDLTNEGGMFYNMQETISQSVKARFKNLHDALDIMFGDIAESTSGDFLKDFAKSLTELTTHWREFFAVAKNIGIAFGAYRLSLLAFNVALGKNNAAILSNILAYKNKRAAELQNEAMVRKLTAEELALIQTRKKITAANIQVALSTNAVTKGEVLKMVALRRVNLEEAKSLIRMGEFTAAEIRMALQGKILGMNLGRTGAIIKLFGQQVGAAAKALFLSPQAWIFALIAGMTELWQMNKEEVERAKEMSDDLFNRANEGIKNTRRMFQETDVVYKVKVGNEEVDATEQFGDIKGGKFEAPNFNDIDTATAMSLMDKWERFIKEYASMPNRLINEAYKDGDEVRELADQYENLKNKMLEVAEAQRLLKDASDAIQYAEDATNGGWLDDSLTTNINDYAKAVRGFNDSVSDLIRKHQKSVASTMDAARADAKFEAALKKLKIATTDYAGQVKELIKNQNQYPTAYNKAIEASRKLPYEEYDAMNGMFFGSGLFDSKNVSDWNRDMDSAKKTMEADISSWVDAMKQKLSEAWNIKDFAKMTEGQKQAVVAAIAETVSKASQGTDAIRTEVRNLMQEKFGIKIDDNTADVAARVAGLKNSLMDLTERTDWHIQVGTNFEDTYGNIKKAYKAAKSYLDSTKPLQMKLAIDVSGGMKELGTMQRTAIVNKWRQQNPGKDSTWLEEYLADFDDHARKLNEALDFSKKTGLSLEDEKKTKGRGAGEDKEAKRLREIAKLYKDAYDWYKKYEKQVGEGGALTKVQSQFQPLFDEFNKTWKTNLSLDSIPLYKKNLSELLDEAMKLYKSPKHKNSYMVSAIKELRDAISNVDYEEAQRKMDEFASKIQIQLDNLTRSWDIFNTVREATGDVNIATQLSGANYDNGTNQNLADSVRHKIEQDFEKAGGNFALDFDINLSDEEIQKLFENTQRWGVTDVEEYEKHIKGLVDEYKKWRDLQRDVYKNDVAIFAKITGNVATYENQLKKIDDEYDRELAALQRLLDAYNKGEKDENGNRKGITQEQYNNAQQALQGRTDWQKYQLGSEYTQYMNGAIGQTMKLVTEAAKAIEAKLNEALKKGAINAKTYAEQMRKIRDIKDKFREDAFFGVQNSVTAFMNGGLKGSNDFVKDRLQALEEKQKNTGLSEEEEKELKHYQLLQEKLSKAIGGLSSFATVLSIATGVLDGLGNACASLANMFQALGNTGAANFWGDLSDGIKAGSSFLAPVNNITQSAMSGNIGGIVSSAISAPIDLFAAPITGFAKLHDKRRERRIQELKEEVTRIANNTELILKTRARTLGYDTGQVRQSYALSYAPNTARQEAIRKEGGMWGAIMANTRWGRGFDSDAQEAMYNYYQQNSGGNGYQQQLANLRSEREKYMRMYDEENDKKDSSGQALEEYKAKIAELDDQIHYFAMDLANELWSIDLKGWAQQLSDALANAFDNGTDMAKAYKETVTSIIQQLGNKMMQLAIIEPMFEKLQTKLFGEKQSDGTWKGGVFNIDDPQGSAKKVTDVISDWFGKNGQGQEMITAAQQFLTAFEQGINNAGLSRKNTDQKTLSSTIGEVSEETASLLAGYVNALRQDVAINRILLTQFITEYWSSYIDQVTSMNTHLANIDNNVAAMSAMFRETGALYGMIENISDRLDRFANGFDTITVK